MHVPYLGPAPDPDPAILALEIAHTDTVIDRTTAEHDRGRLPLTDEQWTEFFTALEAAPRPLPRMTRLLTEPGFFGVLFLFVLLAGCAHKGPQMPTSPILDEEPSCHEELDPNQLKDL